MRFPQENASLLVATVKGRGNIPMNHHIAAIFKNSKQNIPKS